MQRLESKSSPSIFPGPTRVLENSEHLPDTCWMNKGRYETFQVAVFSMRERKHEGKWQEDSYRGARACRALCLDHYPKINEEPLKTCLQKYNLGRFCFRKMMLAAGGGAYFVGI